MRHWQRTFISTCAAVSMAACGTGKPPAATSDVVSLEVPGRSNATPWIAAAGSLVAVTWGGADDAGTDVFVAVSRDSGRTFGPPVQVNAVVGEARLGGELPPRVAFMPGGGTEPEMVVLWTSKGETTGIKTARSRDGGRTFDEPITLQSPEAPGDRGWPALALDTHGTAHAIWLDHRGLAAPASAPATAGEHAGHTMDHHAVAPDDGYAQAQKSGLFYASMGPSATADPPASAERAIAPGVCYCCKTALAVGPDDAIYAAWRHVFPGGIRDIAFTVSRDGGHSFQPISRVSEDGWAINGCPDDGPAMAVDSDGVVHLVWPTAVGAENPEGALFYASTRDGHTFTERVRVPTLGSLKPSHPQIVVDGKGRVVVAWDEFIDGRRVASARRVLLDGHPVMFGDVVTIAPDGPAMYPMLAATDTGVVAVWTTGGGNSAVRVQMLDLTR
jgi:hypothetical protein